MMYRATHPVVIAIVAIFTLPATLAMGQENDHVQEWSKRLESIQSLIRRVGSALSQKGKAFDAGKQEPKKLYEEIRELNEELEGFYQKTRAVYDEIRESRDTLDKEEYRRAYDEYRATYKTYQAAYDEYNRAYKVYRTAEDKHQAAKRETAPAPSRISTRSNAREERNRQLLSQLKAIANEQSFQQGTKVVALTNTQLKAGSETLASIRKGDLLTVEQTRDKWLWVRSGDARGWVDTRTVISCALLAWYERLPDHGSVEYAGRTLGKCYGFMFEIVDAGSQLYGSRWGPNTSVNGYRVPTGGGENVNCQNAGAFLRKAGDRRRELMISFPGSTRPFINIPALRSYGMVDQGAYIFISTNDRSVFVNGQRRRPG